MSEMSEIRNNPNTSPGVRTLCEGYRSLNRCSPFKKCGAGRHHLTAWKKWSKEVYIVVMEYYYRSNPVDENEVFLKKHRQRMYREWLERGPCRNTTEQRICDLVKAIRKNGWLPEIELEMIKGRINTTRPQETDEKENQGVEDSFPDSDELVARPKLILMRLQKKR